MVSRVEHRPHLIRWLIASGRWLCSDLECNQDSALCKSNCNNRNCNRPRPYATPGEAKASLATELVAAEAAAAAAGHQDGDESIPEPPAWQLPTLQELRSAGVRTTAHVPLAARIPMCILATEVLRPALDAPGVGTEAGFTAFCFLFTCILRMAPPNSRGGRPRRRQMDPVKLCLQLISRWSASKQQQLWLEAVAITKAAAEARRSCGRKRPSSGFAVRKAKWLASEGHFADALAAQAAQSMAEATPETRQALRALFSQQATAVQQ